MRAETGSGPPTPACWASMSMVSRGRGPRNPAGEVRGQGAALPGFAMLDRCRGVGVKKLADPAQEAPPAGPRDREGLPGTRGRWVGGWPGRLSAGNGAALNRGWRPGGRAEAGRCARRVA